MERGKGENITGKILALFLAIILWVYVMNEQNPPVEQTVTVKLDIRNVGQGLILTESPESVKVRYRGPRSIIAGMRPQDMEAFVDANGAEEGEHSLPVKTVIPGALEVIEVVPNTVTIRLEGQISRQVAVSPKFTGTAPAGVIIDKAEVVPAQVTVSGQRSKVDQVAAVTVAVDMKGIDRDVVLGAAPHAYGQNGAEVEGVYVSPDKIQVKVSVLQNIITKSVDVRSDVTGELASGATIEKITTEPAKIEVRGQAEILKKIDWVPTFPVDVSGQSADIVREVKLQQQEGVTFTKGNTVKVFIKINAPPPALPQR